MKRFLPLLLALLLAAPAWGQLTVRYADFDLATGANDGTSEANAWQTWAAMNSGLSAGMCVNVQRTSSRHDPGADQAPTTNGSSTAPIILVGYNTTPGDCGATSWGDGFDSGISNFFQYGSRKLSPCGDNWWIFFFDITASANFDSASTQCNTGHVRFVHSIIDNTAANSGGVVCGNYNAVLGSQVKINPTGTIVNNAIDAREGCFVVGNRIYVNSTGTGAATGIKVSGASSSQTGAIAYNLVRGPDTAGTERGVWLTNTTTSDDTNLILGNTFADLNSAIETTAVNTGTAGDIRLIHNLTQNVDFGFDNLDGSPGNRGLVDFGNAFDANTTNWDNTGTGVPMSQFVDLSADSCTDISTWDCTINNTSGGGADVRDAAEPFFFNLELTPNDEEFGANSYGDEAGAGATSSIAALTDRYADFDLASGANDGTSEANAWQSWADVVAGVAAGQRVCVQQVASRHNTGATFTTQASTSAKIKLEGYKTSCGDGGDDGINNYFQSGNAAILVEAGYHVKYFDFTGDPGAASARLIDAPNLSSFTCEYCYIEDTDTGKAGNPVVELDDEGRLIASHVVAPAGSVAVALVDGGGIFFSTVDISSGADGIQTNTWTQFAHVVGNTIFGGGTTAGRAIFATGSISPADAQDETSYDGSPTTEGTFTGGSGYSVSDVITLSDSSTATVDAVSAGVVTQFTVANSASTGADVGDTLTQSSVSPAGGSGFTLTLDYDNIEAAWTDGNVAKSRFIAHNTISNVREGLVFADTRAAGGGAFDLAINNVIYDVDIAIWNINGTSCSGVTVGWNGTGSCGVECYKNWNDCPVEYGAVTIASDPFESAASGDYRLKNTATDLHNAALSVDNFTGSGTLARHLGAVQAVAPAAAGRPKIW